MWKSRFIDLYSKYIRRDGSKEFLQWIEATDFFEAPASTKYHCAKHAGLVEHSVKVYEVFREKHFDQSDDEESFAICGLLHDVCKINYYKESTRNVKNEQTGAWEKVPCYNVEDAFPYGHGEKSVFLIERFIRLKPSEAMAIRWHMGGFDKAIIGGDQSMGIAYDKFPLAIKLFLADMESTYLREKGTSEVRR